MKNCFKLGISFLLSCFLFQGVIGQNDDYQMYNVHEDHVKPSKVAEYEQIGKELIAELKKHQIKGVNWISLATDDFRYAFLSPINKLGELDSNMFAELEEKMGEGKLGKLFERMDKCYSDHNNYVLVLDKKLSYMPEGITQVPEGENYRENSIYYFSPENQSKAMELAQKYKDLYSKMNSKFPYRIYHSGFGAGGTYILVAMAAKDPADFYQKQMANSDLLGDEGLKLQKELLQIIDKSEMMVGWIRPDLGYTGGPK